MYFSHKINVEKCAEILPNWENMDKVPLTSKENNICYICKEKNSVVEEIKIVTFQIVPLKL